MLKWTGAIGAAGVALSVYAAPQAQAQADLAGSQWTVVELAGTTVTGAGTVRFDDGRVSGKAACNRFRGDWKAVASGLKIGALATTRMFCEGRMEMEKALLDALQAAAFAERSGTVLVLKDGGGKPVVRFAPAN